MKNFWCLYRFNPDQELILVGEPLNPYSLLQIAATHNPVLLCNKLNAGNFFDKPIHFKGNDDPTNYGFEFRKDKWRVIDYETFEWLYKHEELEQGKIKML